MTTKTRAEQTVEMLRTRMPVTPRKSQQDKHEDTAGMDNLAKRRAALKKLEDFKYGVI